MKPMYFASLAALTLIAAPAFAAQDMSNTTTTTTKMKPAKHAHAKKMAPKKMKTTKKM